MKKLRPIPLLLLFLSVLLTPLTVQGQENRERIKALKIAFITEKLELTGEEAAQFWPVYNRYEEALGELRAKKNKSLLENLKRKQLSEITSSEAKQSLEELISFHQQETALEEAFYRNLAETVPIQKVAYLQVLEAEFNQRLLERLKTVRSQRRP